MYAKMSARMVGKLNRPFLFTVNLKGVLSFPVGRHHPICSSESRLARKTTHKHLEGGAAWLFCGLASDPCAKSYQRCAPEREGSIGYAGNASSQQDFMQLQLQAVKIGRDRGQLFSSLTQLYSTPEERICQTSQRQFFEFTIHRIILSNQWCKRGRRELLHSA